MANVRVKLNHAALEGILNTAAQGLASEQAHRVASRAESMGSGSYKVESHAGAPHTKGMPVGGRRFYVVKPADFKARMDNARHNTLLKALGR